MNPEIGINSIENDVFNFFDILFNNYQDELEGYSDYYLYSPQLIAKLEKRGNDWLNTLNKNLIKERDGKKNSNIFRFVIQTFKKL